MSQYSDLVKGGCSWVHALQIAGVPYIFTEIEAKRVDAQAFPGVPSGYESFAPALVIKKGMKAGIRIDRYAGVASGDAIDLILSWDGLASGGSQTSDLKADLFQHPTTIVRLDESIDETTGSKLVDDTSAWTFSHGYIGTERVATTVVDSTHINLTSRGLNGSRANVYSVRSPTFSRLADRPLVWRGREVTLWRILTAPDGSVIDATLCDPSSTNQRVLWRGYIDSPPRAVAEGISLRALPLVRRLALPIGHSVAADVFHSHPGPTRDHAEFTTFNQALSDMPVRSTPGQTLFNWRVEQNDGDVLVGSTRILSSHADGVMTLQQMVNGFYGYPGASKIVGGIYDGLASSANFSVNPGSASVFFLELPFLESAPVMRITFQLFDSTLDLEKSNLVVPPSAPYWLIPGTYEFVHHPETGGGGYTVNDSYQSVTIPINPFFLNPGFWFPVQQTEGTEYNDVTLPSSGFALIDREGEKMIIEWDSKIDSFESISVPGLAMLRVREVHYQPQYMYPFAGAQLKYISGKIGSVKDCLLTLLESSGAGNRGTFDTLGVGQGCGIHEDQIDEVSLGFPGISDYQVTLYAEGKTAVSDLVGGHLALRQLCFVQRLTDADAVATGASVSGDVVLALVTTVTPVIDSSSPTLSASDMILEAIEAPEAAEVPNVINVSVGTLIDADDNTIAVQDVPRLQAEGPRDQSYNAPGLSMQEALQLSASIIAQGDGQLILQIQVAPWVEIQPGDAVNLTIAHPMVYDYATATRAPTSVAARCLGWSTDLFDGTQRLTLLLAGSAAGIGFLCPSVTILSKPTASSVTVAEDDLQWLTAGAKVQIYEPGEEILLVAEYEISTISGTTINFTASIGSWVAAGSVITYPTVANCNTRQSRFTHNAITYRLG